MNPLLLILALMMPADVKCGPLGIFPRFRPCRPFNPGPSPGPSVPHPSVNPDVPVEPKPDDKIPLPPDVAPPKPVEPKPVDVKPTLDETAIRKLIQDELAKQKPAAGKDGRNGVDGKPGRDGVDGKPGRDGVDGKAGKDGQSVDTASLTKQIMDGLASQLKPMQTDIANLKNDVAGLKTDVAKMKTQVYTAILTDTNGNQTISHFSAGVPLRLRLVPLQ